MSQRQRKTASSHAKPLKAPGLHRKVQSSTHLHTQSQQSGHRPTLGGNKRASTYVVDYGEDEESGSASFPQFCTTCDTQIVNPVSSLLYCSEACRKQDGARPPPARTALSPLLSLSHATSYFDDHPPPNYIPQRSPTIARPLPSTLPTYATAETDSSSEDADQRPHRSKTQQTAHLSRTHQTPDHQSARPLPPNPKRSSTASTLPSLTHTPSSSPNTLASTASYHQNPKRSLPCTSSTKSIDLVMPSFDTIPNGALLKSSVRTLSSAETLSYEKRRPASREWREEDARGSLKMLFEHEAMRRSVG